MSKHYCSNFHNVTLIPLNKVHTVIFSHFLSKSISWTLKRCKILKNYPENCSFWSYSMFNDSKGGFWRFSPTFWSLQWTFLFSAEKLRNCIWKKCDHDKEVVFLLWCHSAASLPPHKNFFLNEIFACLLVCQKWRNHSIEKI